MTFDDRLNNTWWTLRIALGVAPILAGLDKFLNLLTNWGAYLHPAIPQMANISAATFMQVVGVIEIVAGVVVLSSFTRLGAYIVMAWLIGISLSLIGQGRYFDIAVRDLLLAVAAYSLARLTEARESVRADAPQQLIASAMPRAS